MKIKKNFYSWPECVVTAIGGFFFLFGIFNLFPEATRWKRLYWFFFFFIWYTKLFSWLMAHSYQDILIYSALYLGNILIMIELILGIDIFIYC